jgi:hypothetical protein
MSAVPPFRDSEFSGSIEVDESDHFLIQYIHRHPAPGRDGRGVGRLGVRHPHMITSYVTALERLFAVATMAPFPWMAARTGPSGKTIVQVTDLRYPFTAIDEDGVPYIGLHCRSDDPLLPSAIQHAEMDAVHEAAHVFCFSSRPPHGFVERKWRWFNEATAVFMEGHVFPGNLDSIRFALDWTDHPEASLDNPGFEYQSGFFARYLAKRFTPAIVGRMWTESHKDEAPLEALERLLPTDAQSHAPGLCRVFGDYAHDSAFLCDFRCSAAWVDVYLRFGQRAFTHTVCVAPGDTRVFDGRLDHLACRYFRIEPSRQVDRCAITVRVDDALYRTFRCFASVAEMTLRRRVVVELTDVDELSGGLANQHTLRATMTREQLHGCESIIITIANCGTRDEEYCVPGERHDDRRHFQVEVLTN